MIKIQTEDFDHAFEYARLREGAKSDGAIVTFTGLVRDHNEQGAINSLFIEHYPGMTEKALETICMQARAKWQLGQITIIHRVGHLQLNQQIVFIGVTSKHRKSAFESVQFIMDYLKKDAPFWKQEVNDKGAQWVAQKTSDINAALAWQKAE